MKNSFKMFVMVLSTMGLAGMLKAGPPSAADVGDAESFGHAALYMGAASGFVTLADVCDPTPTPVPPATANDSQCFVINPAPANTHFDANDICRIKLPKKATRTVIYPAVIMFVSYQLHNTTGVDQPQGRLNFTATLTVESDALLDPALIDPNTGLPYNGKLEGQFPYIFRDDHNMRNGDRNNRRETLVRVGNTGLTKAQFVAQGLPASVVDAMFAGAMTIRMSVTGDAKLCESASITGNMRLFGD